MSVKPVRSTVYKKIFLSFFIIVILFSVLNGIIAYAFSRSYENQVYDDSQVMLTRIGEQLDERIFQQTHALYVDLVTNPTLYPEALNFLRGKYFDPLSYYRLYISLRASLIRAPGKFSSVSLYSCAEDSVVSSISGVKWVREQKQGKYTDWVQYALQSKEQIFWQYTVPQVVADEQIPASIVMYATYPNNTTGQDCTGIIKMQINIDAINDILQEYQINQSAYYLIDKNGEKVVGKAGNSVDFKKLYGNQLDEKLKEKYIGVYEIDDKKNVIISQPFQQDYVLVGITSLNSFYEKINTMRNSIYLFGLGILLLGLFLAAIFSNQLYRPLHQLIEPAIKRYGNVATGMGGYDEYAYISVLMENLFSKASSLETVLQQNFPLIQNALLQSLLQDSSIDERAIQEKFDFLHLSFQYPLFCVIRLHIPANEFEKMSIEKKELVLYGLLSGYSEYRNNEIALYGVKSAADTLTIIVNMTDNAWRNCDTWMYEIKEICIHYSGVRPQMCMSTCVDSKRNISQINRQTSELEQYFYFMPQLDYMTVERIPALQPDHAECIPAQILEDFANNIKQNQVEETQKNIIALVEYCKTGKYTVQHCNQRILSMLFTFSRFIRNTNVKENDPFYEKIHSDFLKCNNIDHFQEWFNALVTHYLQLVTQNANGNYSAMMKEITEYINHHLTESISLEMLAETFLLSSSYLSRRFKEEAGVNYTDFVNNAKLVQAANQLINTAKRIDEIAEETGFNSSAYFIRKFREKYGVTPKKYRMDAVFHQTTGDL